MCSEVVLAMAKAAFIKKNFLPWNWT